MKKNKKAAAKKKTILKKKNCYKSEKASQSCQERSDHKAK